ncbi:MAG: thioredoxin-dependent thiol peroxidase [Candidatus Diapherotrites archaeon]
MPMPKEGTKAPDFTLKDTNGNNVTLSHFKGKKIVLYFYPKDDTPGCTKEACEFRDNLERVKRKGALVFGISKDDEKSHQRFTEKYQLNFPILSDPQCIVLEKYGAWGEKSLYGKKFMGIIRSTFIIDEDGKIMKVFPRVSPEGHAEEVIQALGN